MKINDVEKLLAVTQYGPFIGTLEKITLKEYTYPDHFKMGNDRLGYYSIKIRGIEVKNVMNSINIIKAMIDTEKLFNSTIGIVEKGGYVLLISEWLHGTQPIDIRRDALPVFFAKLAVFNKNNATKGPFTSMYMDSSNFNSIDEMTDREIKYHKKYLNAKLGTKWMFRALEELNNGIPCIINEDMNCGNFMITDDGKYKIIDTEWIIRGNNLYQFQHIDYFGFGGGNWYTVTGEAKDCYRAYFETLGVSNSEANDQIKAIELLNVLRENTYWMHSGKGDDTEIEKRIQTVLQKEKYI